MPFSKLGLSKPLLQGVQAMGYGDPTPVQLRAIPPALEGRDVIASAQTGTGKTAAFALPTLQKLGNHGRLRCLVLEPTRELAMQVETSMRDLARFTNLTVGSVFGGVGYGAQRAALRDGLDILVATPGRLEDHLQQGTVKLQDIEVLVLDEVDRMLDVGFLPPMRRIIGKCPKDRQTLFFSATLPPEIAELSAWALRDPVRIEIGASRSVTSTVKHGVYITEQSRKFGLLLALLDATDYQSVLIFSRTKHGADRIARRLRDNNHSVGVLHANRSQNQRIEALEGFKSGKYEVMVATDIAARGIDVAGVSHVINYDIPVHPEDYVHRIGRTGRAAQTGDAFTLVTNEEMKKLSAIERFIGQKIERLQLEGTNVPLHGEQLAPKKPKIEPRMDGRPSVPGRGGRRRGQGWRRRH
ncbi:MAG: DEAD/DEAH box helicase [Chthoniobacterales bacterium]|nr:DEAD/DEAH box helicase [Chthoniobacterales bacterium]